MDTARLVETARGPIELAELGEGPAVIVSHGTFGGWDQGLVLARTMCEPGFRYLAVSRPGYLGTPVASGRTCEEQGDLLAALLDALELEQAAVIGVSAGGPAAIELALRHPERLWGLVLVSTCAAPSEPPGLPPGFGLMARLMQWHWLRDKMRAGMEEKLADSVEIFISDREAFDRTMADPEDGPLFRQFFLGAMDGMDKRVKGTRKDVATMESAEHALEQIALPTLVVHGTDDQMLSYDTNAKAFAARIPQAELLTIEGGEHVAIFSHRALIRPAIMAWLREHAPS